MEYLRDELKRRRAEVERRRFIRQRETPQHRPIPGSAQVPNSAGGYTWAVDDWTRLHRFLVLGSEGGSYYASEAKLSAENADAVLRCIAADGPRVVDTLVAVSEAGRAPKNDAALFVLALCAARGHDETRRAVIEALPRVARIGTHLFHFVAFVDALRGWGRGLRQAVGNWYNARPARDLAYQALKYQQRDGWSHREVLRLAHPKAPDEPHQTIYHWIAKGWEWVGEMPHPDVALQQIWAFERAKRAGSAEELTELIRTYRLPREAVPAHWLAKPQIWEAFARRDADDGPVAQSRHAHAFGRIDRRWSGHATRHGPADQSRMATEGPRASHCRVVSAQNLRARPRRTWSAHVAADCLRDRRPGCCLLRHV
ncbi:MAG: hypothetical protein ETSY1_38220 [Candidatus Entotheonella factor]|uniref:TROVE domain-containing protein n=1 Tax=Entotheonella factor TaxID=1429438 RepID=W4L6X4_ENTF1|nr:MAG: hypothetical protein ETSY1_38220 [Candidatus Entotheonella factor]